MSNSTSILAELVAIPSVHPEADAGGTKPGEAAIAAWVSAYLRSCGATVTTPLLARDRPSVIGTFEPHGKASSTIVFAPHLDTVGVGGMTVPPFRLTRHGERLHGRGACDTKGPLAALLAALRQWSRHPSRLNSGVRVIVAATAGEEQGSLGAQKLMGDGLRAEFAIALEPTRLRVVSAAKGVLRVWVETKGRAAHGSRPSRGINAVDRMLPFAQAVGTVVAPELRSRPHPLLGVATVNLGVIEGGRELNIVPDRCRIGLDIRTHPRWTERDALRLIHRVSKRFSPDASVSVLRRSSSFISNRRGKWAARLRRNARGWDIADWFCDANIFGARGIPSVAFGPGSIAQAHTRDEYINEEDLEAGTRAFLQFLCSL